MTPPSMVRIAVEIESLEYEQAKKFLQSKNIKIEQEIERPNDIKSKSIFLVLRVTLYNS